jgi:hypothetical protein
MDFSLENILKPFNNVEYCDWFYYLSLIGFIILISILLLIILSLTKKEKTKKGYYLATLAALVTYTVFYFQNRLLYSMCVKSI